ncbi:MAG: hypothetical protein M1457_00635 [bacterium]|nr:hypothetical protein [bacterium]
MVYTDAREKDEPMGEAVDLKALRQLEEEARACERNEDFTSALDIYEDILRRDWADARLLLAMGHCYLRNRQRQNAKQVWIRAHELDPGFDEVQEELDHYFPGWEKKDTTSGKSGRRTMTPPPPFPARAAGERTILSEEPPGPTQSPPPSAGPPPPPAFSRPRGSSISMTTISPSMPVEEPEAAPAISKDGQRPPIAAAPGTPGSAARIRPRTPAPKMAPAAPAPASPPEEKPAAAPSIAGLGLDKRVNWDYVLEDAAEALSQR